MDHPSPAPAEQVQVITPEVIEAIRRSNPVPPGRWLVPADMAPIRL